ncbi:MAG: ribonuclease HI family protein [Candidatus Brocadiales bacterium]|nr:ribonuclease HI family protein [Candidatus Bathyanammoxibius amoris]
MKSISDQELLELIRKGIDPDSVKAADPRATRKRLEEFFSRMGDAIRPKLKSDSDSKKKKVVTPVPKGRILIYTDGASRGNPGKAGIGVVIRDGEHNVLDEIGEYIGETTNNVAEYRALIRGLEWALEYHPVKVDVFCDSELVVKQVNGQYKVRAPSILPLHREARKLIGKLPEWRLQYIPREENVQADALANEGIDEYLDSTID